MITPAELVLELTTKLGVEADNYDAIRAAVDTAIAVYTERDREQRLADIVEYLAPNRNWQTNNAPRSGVGLAQPHPLLPNWWNAATLVEYETVDDCVKLRLRSYIGGEYEFCNFLAPRTWLSADSKDLHALIDAHAETERKLLAQKTLQQERAQELQNRNEELAQLDNLRKKYPNA